ncbi:MAG: hypothetical protein A2W31_11465 [Planctomycetes bacterium RBG_16_64_10]|nr:MAG: hypothetical protein A2W31_11465 [Planctomycetes bacterium RBG_16_64_10]
MQGRTMKGRRPDKALAVLNSPEVKARLRAWRQRPENPIFDPVVRRKAELTMREKGYIHFRHGGSQGLTVPQQLLAARIGWPTEVIVRLNTLPCRARDRKEKAVRPYKYMLDIADSVLKIGIEVDGPSHRGKTRMEHDKKRDERLTALGWTILRFTNREILADLELVVEKIMEVVKSTTSKPRPETTSPKES